MRKFLTLTAASLILIGCGAAETVDTKAKAATDATYDEVLGSDTVYVAGPKFDAAKLDSILAAQPDEVQARYSARNPAETLEFFGITPGMAVGEALPGGGWYTKILAPYLGADGKLVGIDYTIDMWSEFGFANEAFIETKKKWPAEFVAKSAEWASENGPDIMGRTFGTPAGDMAGQLDAILYVRALHNLSRFETEGAYMTQALKSSHDLLKPGGLVGVVQHRAPSTWEDAAANGSAGYLKQDNLIAAFEAAGFDLVKSSEVNANPKDQPGDDDIVWRLPPSLNGVGDDAALKAERMSIGESDRMTLLFKKR
ncbi:MAG: methyltransferase [Litorimonas sp.]